MAYTNAQLFALLALRLFVGWHFLFEGLSKLFASGWTAKAYLAGSPSPLAPFFRWLASDAVIGFADVLTVGALIAVGLSLLLGLFERWGTALGMVLLAFFYLAYPAWPGLSVAGPAEGNYFIVDKHLVELAALGVLACFPTGQLWGLRAKSFQS